MAPKKPQPKKPAKQKPQKHPATVKLAPREQGVDGDNLLTDNELAFVHHWIVCRNSAEAYRKAGYKCKNNNVAGVCGHQLLGKPKIQRAVAAAIRELELNADVNPEWITKQYVRNYLRSMQAVPVRDALGRPTGEYRYDGAVANKALESLAKMIGALPDGSTLDLRLRGKIKHTHTGSVTQEHTVKVNELLSQIPTEVKTKLLEYYAQRVTARQQQENTPTPLQLPCGLVEIPKPPVEGDTNNGDGKAEPDRGSA